jgi:tetratricopeptide (TPR) repeat protein
MAETGLAAVEAALKAGKVVQARALIDAETAGRKLSALPPEHLVQIGRVAIREAKWQASLDAWNELLKRKPPLREAYFKGGKCLQMLDRHDDAIRWLIIARRMSVPEGDVALLLARSFAALNKHWRAKQNWQIAAKTLEITQEIGTGLIAAMLPLGQYGEIADLCAAHAGNGRILLGIADMFGEAMIAAPPGTRHSSLWSTAVGVVAEQQLRGLLEAAHELRFGDALVFAHHQPMQAVLPKTARSIGELLILRAAAAGDPGDSARRLAAALRSGEISAAAGAQALVNLCARGESDAAFQALARAARPALPLLMKALREVGEARLSVAFAETAFDCGISKGALRTEHAAALRALGETEAAIELWRDAALWEGEASALPPLVDLLIAERRYTDAEASLEAYQLSYLTEGAQVHGAAMVLHGAMRRHRDALAAAEARIAHGKAPAEAHIRRASALVALVEPEAALVAINEGLRSHPGAVQLLLLLASTCRALGKGNEAFAAFLRLAAAAPINAQALAAFADFLRTDAPKGALATYIEAASVADLGPDEEAFLKASLDYESGDVEAALARLAEAEPGRLPPWRKLALEARCLVSRHRAPEAEAVITPSLAMPDPPADLLRDALAAYCAAGNYPAGARLVARFPRAFSSSYLRNLSLYNRLDIRLDEPQSSGWWSEYADFPYVAALDRLLPSRKSARGGKLAVLPVLGIGDEIRTASIYREIIAAEEQQVTFFCEPRLQTLLSRNFPQARFEPCLRRGAAVHSPSSIAAARGLPDIELSRILDGASWAKLDGFDRVLLSSECLAQLRPSAAAYKERSPYLAPSRAHVEKAKAMLPQGGRRIGISWRSSLIRTARMVNYSALSNWGPVFALPGARFFSFQHDAEDGEIRAAEERFGITIERLQGADLRDDFEMIAALLSQMDAMIGPSVTVVEFAAALGIETALLWRVPSFRHRTHAADGRDIWYRAAKTIHAEPLADEAAMMTRAAQHIGNVLPNPNG